MNLKAKGAEFAIKQAMKTLHNDPEKGMELLVKATETLAPGAMPSQRKLITEIFNDKDCSWHHFILRILDQIDPDVLDTLVVNYFVNVGLVGWPKEQELRREYNCNIPINILMDPTSACNLKCKGCWAADYGNRLNLTLEELDDIINQGLELGVYWYMYSGGEPMVRKKDLITLCERHPECVFGAFTNGTLIDEQFCEDMLRVKNFIPQISIEGTRESTDLRRGEGTFDRVQDAMRLLREHKLPFGVSTCYTSANMDYITSDEYADQLIEWGALYAWYFHYMPVGSKVDLSLLPTPEQRRKMYDTSRKWREEKELFVIDFQDDGEFAGGCVAGGRRFLHINANGNVDPCAFVHFSDSNIREKTLLECLQSPLFMGYHNRQPFNDNMLRPCPMLENPEALRAIVKESGAISTDMENPEDVDELCARCDQYAADWGGYADKLWEQFPHIMPFEP